MSNTHTFAPSWLRTQREKESEVEESYYLVEILGLKRPQLHF